MLSRLLSILLPTLTTVLPLVFWTLTPNFFATPRELLLLLTLVLCLLAYALDIYHSRTLSLPRSSLTLSLLLFTATLTLSLIVNPEGRPEALAGKGLILLALPTLSLLALSSDHRLALKRHFTTAYLVSSAVLALLTLVTLTLASRLTLLPAFMQTQSFTPTGAPYLTLSLLLLGAVLGLSHLSSISTRLRPFLLAHLILMTITIVAMLSLMLPGGSLTPQLIPYLESWGIALDALKSPRSLLFGIGLSNFSLLYSAVKPLSLNSTPLWNTLPTTSGSELLTLLATAGLLPTLVFLTLPLRRLLTPHKEPLDFFLFGLLLSFLLLPASLTHYFLLFITLTLCSTDTPHRLTLKSPLPLIVPLALSLATLTLAYSYSRILLAEYNIRAAQLALQKNDAKAVYDSHLRALALAPKTSSYHLSFANINLSLASALSQKPNLTEADRQDIATLIQTSLTSAKNAASLRPNDPSAYVALATTYQNLINVAEGAEQFALVAYAAAVRLDRANPTLRLLYGGLLQKLYTESEGEQKNLYLTRATTEYQTAIQLKNDYANAYYNLAQLMSLSSQNTNAIKALEAALRYLDPASPDYAKAESELNSLKSSSPRPSASPLPSSSPHPSPEGGDSL